MPITRSEVEHIAELAKLALTEEEKTLYEEQLSAILDYAGRLKQVDTSAIPPTTTVLPLRSVMRTDEPSASLPREDVLANAPATQNDSFAVQAILE